MTMFEAQVRTNKKNKVLLKMTLRHVLRVFFPYGPMYNTLVHFYCSNLSISPIFTLPTVEFSLFATQAAQQSTLLCVLQLFDQWVRFCLSLSRNNKQQRPTPFNRNAAQNPFGLRCSTWPTNHPPFSTTNRYPLLPYWYRSMIASQCYTNFIKYCWVSACLWVAALPCWFKMEPL